MKYYGLGLVLEWKDIAFLTGFTPSPNHTKHQQKKMADNPPLYSSRILKIFIDYLHVAHPDIDIRDILKTAGITAEEAEDSAHWFTQQETDRWYEAMVEKTGDTEIARKAGRFSVSSEGISHLLQYAAAFLSTETALMSLKKLYGFLSRAATIKVTKISPRKFEVISTPLEGVEEKPYQCENRLGTIEAMPMLFTNRYAQIEHVECYHKGASACRYIISWQNPPSQNLRLIRNYGIPLSLAAAACAFFLLPIVPALLLFTLLLALNLVVNSIYTSQKTKELVKIINYHHDWADDQIELANTRYNNSLLAQEIGQATSAIYNIDELMQRLAELLHNRLHFDRGLIMLANKERTRLIFSAGYGYSDHEWKYLQNISFRLEPTSSKGYFVRAFHEQRHIITTNAEGLSSSLSEKSQRVIQHFKVRSLLCVPIIYKKNSLGILAVDNLKTKSPLKKSDINLLEGIAAQIAISISNAIAFQKLHESEEKYRQTLESINEGYYEITLDKQIQFANNALCRLLACSLDQLVTSNFMAYFPQGAQKQLDLLFDAIKASREPVHFSQLEIKPSSGENIPVDLSASIIIDHNDEAIGFRGILRDATERLQLEREKKQLESQLLQAQKMEAIGTLAGGIAHNFNNWLAGILGNITLIRMDAKGQPKIIQRSSRIENIIENAAKMTQQLLGYARSGNYEAQLINVNRIIQEAADTFAETKKEISITLSLDPELCLVKVDKSQIEQVFWNLFVNAIDAMPDGGNLHISTKNTNAKMHHSKYFKITSGNYVAIEFSDTGMGIAPDNMKKIFEPFFTTKEGKGTGLGLASSFGIIKAHKGFIDVESQPGDGATFKILLPVAGEQPGKERSSNKTVQQGRGTILVVDDEAMILETSEQLLVRLGYEVITASSGEEALSIFKDNPEAIDLVIIDMIMPAMSGRDLFNCIKEIMPSAKTLLCSGYSLNENAREIMHRGCNGFMQKPFNINQLSSTISRILQPEVEAR